MAKLNRLSLKLVPGYGDIEGNYNIRWMYLLDKILLNKERSYSSADYFLRNLPMSETRQEEMLQNPGTSGRYAIGRYREI